MSLLISAGTLTQYAIVRLQMMKQSGLMALNLYHNVSEERWFRCYLNFKVRWLARQKVTRFLLCSFVYDLRAYITTIKTTKNNTLSLDYFTFQNQSSPIVFYWGFFRSQIFFTWTWQHENKKQKQKKLKSDLYQRDCRSQQILSLERGTSIFFGYVTQYTSVRRGAWRKEQRLRSERVAFWLAWMISFEEC